MKSIAQRLAILRGVFGSPVFVSLHTADPEAGNEVSYPNYARIEAVFTVDESLGLAMNAERIIFVECENADMLVTHIGIHQGGELKYYDQLPEPVRVSHLIRPEIPAGAIKVVET